MRRGEKSLEVRAKQHISICCKTLCEREIVEEYINQLEERVKELEQMVENLGEESRGEGR
jgi:phosphopantetheine adenylyltransferase